MSDLEKLPPDHGINVDPETVEDRSFAERKKDLERAFAEYKSGGDDTTRNLRADDRGKERESDE